MKTLVLASSSPARREILEQTGHPFVVDVSDYEEDMSLDLQPRELAVFLSQGKARDVAPRHKNAVVIGADSFVVFKGELMGKPHTHERARQMLAALSGECHSFVTGYTVIDTDSGQEQTGSAETKVYFKALTSQDIEDYLAKENVLLKAGAYSIQGLGKVLVEKIEGDYDNVRGLPLAEVARIVAGFGITIKLPPN